MHWEKDRFSRWADRLATGARHKQTNTKNLKKKNTFDSVCLWVERETEHCSKTAPRLLLWPKKSTFDILWLRAGVVELAWLWESWGTKLKTDWERSRRGVFWPDPTLKSISKYYVLDYTNWWPSIIFRLYKNNDLDLWWFDQTPHWRQYPRILFRFHKWPPTQRKQWSGSLAKIYLYAEEYK